MKANRLWFSCLSVVSFRSSRCYQSKINLFAEFDYYITGNLKVAIDRVVRQLTLPAFFIYIDWVDAMEFRVGNCIKE